MLTRCICTSFTMLLFCFAHPTEARDSSPQYRVIIDSDAKNEIDDQYTIVYILKHPQLRVLGINATQFARPGSVQESYEEIKKILDLMDLTDKVPVFRGAEHALADRKTPQPSEAAEFIIDQARKSTEKLYIVAHGALTNVASAYLLAPDIADRVELYWLGGSFWPGGGREFNAENDPRALQVTMESPLSVHLIPAHGVGGLLGLSFNEAKRHLEHTEPVGDFLVERFRQIGDASRAIWDLSAPALLLHPEWGSKIEARAPTVTNDLEYLPNPNGKIIHVFTDLDADTILDDFFSRFPRPVKSAPLEIVGASCVEADHEVLVEFSHFLDRQTAEDAQNYSISGVEILAARLSGDRTKVLLTTSSHEAGKTYDLRVEGVADIAKEPSVIPKGSSVTYQYFPSFGRGAKCEFYQFDEPLFDFPDIVAKKPDYVGTFSTVSFPYTLGKLRHTEFLENFVLRCSGYVQVSEDLPHTYWVESTGGVRLRIGKDQIFGKRPQSSTLALAAKVQLPKGVHRFTLEYIPNHRIHTLLFYWHLPHGHPTLVPETHLFHDLEAGAN